MAAAIGNTYALDSPRKRGKSIVNRARTAILGCFEVVNDSDKPMKEVLAEAFTDDPIKFMTMAAKYIPKDINVDIQHSMNPLQLTDEQLQEIIDSRRKVIDGEVIEQDCIEVDSK